MLVLRVGTALRCSADGLRGLVAALDGRLLAPFSVHSERTCLWPREDTHCNDALTGTIWSMSLTQRLRNVRKPAPARPSQSSADHDACNERLSGSSPANGPSPSKKRDAHSASHNDLADQQDGPGNRLRERGVLFRPGIVATTPRKPHGSLASRGAQIERLPAVLDAGLPAWLVEGVLWQFVHEFSAWCGPQGGKTTPLTLWLRPHCRTSAGTQVVSAMDFPSVCPAGVEPVTFSSGG